MTKKGYGGAITSEQFCFFETRTVARLICEGKGEKDVVDEVVSDNLFQYPTERKLASIAKACYKRMAGLNDMGLVEIVAEGSTEEAKQVCLYAMMRQYPIVWDFMVRVIGEKYRVLDMSFDNMNLNTFFVRLQDSNEEAAAWSDSTIGKLKQVLRRLLVENEYLDDSRSDHINPVYLESRLENGIRANGDEDALLAFNCIA